MRKTRKPITVAMCALVLALGVNATYAYLTDSASVANTFTVGNVDIELVETKDDFKMIPGQTIEKDPKVSVSAQSEDCWLFVKVDAANGAENYLEYPIAEGWHELDGRTGVYYRIVMNSDVSREFSILANDEVLVKQTVDREMMESLIQTENGELKVDADGNYVLVDDLPKLIVSAYAIQYAGFEPESSSDEDEAAAAALAWTNLGAN